MNKNVIKLTESDLHRLVKEAVATVLKESENIEENGFDTARSFLGQYGRRGINKFQQMGRNAKQGAQNVVNRAQQMGQQAGQAIRQGYQNVANRAQEMGQQAGQAIRQGAQNVGNAVANGYNNVRNDIQQTAKNARQDSSMKDMQKAFNNFKSAVEKYKDNGGQVNNQLASRVSGIDKMMNKYNPNF